ncbi:hypothetical protein LCM17_06600 [Cereibacter sphaeroides]|nr:hypothetical protein [Cereibacter sphaeroides]
MIEAFKLARTCDQHERQIASDTGSANVDDFLFNHGITFSIFRAIDLLVIRVERRLRLGVSQGDTSSSCEIPEKTAVPAEAGAPILFGGNIERHHAEGWVFLRD